MNLTPEINNQVTANLILNDAFARRKQIKSLAKVDINDLEELKEYQGRKRKEFESYLKRNRLDMGQWIRYALFEVQQHDIRRARSVFERALLVDISYIPLWIRYIDSELKMKYIKHARNLLERAVTTLPRVDKLWYKYLFVEESLENWDIVRALYNKWCSLEPAPNAWDSYIQFEIRQQKWDNVRDIFSNYVLVHPQLDTWLEWVKFETVHGSTKLLRNVYSLALDTMMTYRESMVNVEGFDTGIITLIISFANWESTNQEFERSRAIFKLALDIWPDNPDLKSEMVQFEKKFGNISTIEDSVIFKRKQMYKQELKRDPLNSDKWWIYLDLVEKYFSEELLDIFELAVTESKPSNDSLKSTRWKRYIYLWIRFLIYVELRLGDNTMCHKLYERLVNEVIPHKMFTFPEIWIMYAKFEIRQENISGARKILGRSIGQCPNDDVFRYYIQLEIELKEFDRVRKLYEKYLEYAPSNASVWVQYAKLEEDLGDEERARGIFEITQREDVVELSRNSRLKLLIKFIDFETDMEEYDSARKLYRKRLVLEEFSAESWINFAMYEASTPTPDQVMQLQKRLEEVDEEEEEEIIFEPTEVNYNRARKVYEEALEYYHNKKETNNRAKIFEAYSVFENRYGNNETQQSIRKRMPHQVRKLHSKDGIEKEYIDYVFPDDKAESTPDVPKLLEMAKKWKKSQDK